MPRRNRLCPPGIAQHVIQRGNNRQACFCSDEDFSAYAHWLREYAEKYEVQIHAWVFMTNHVHLLLTPQEESGVSKLMQSLGRKYVQYFNYVYQRSGTLWEGRFKSCLVQSAEYLMGCYRYIELNPVRANMIKDPAEYAWSSYRSNALGVASKMITYHREYLKLGYSDAERQVNYRDLFKYQLDGKMIKDIRESVNSNLILGSERFKNEVEFNVKQSVRLGRAGRPKKISL